VLYKGKVDKHHQVCHPQSALDYNLTSKSINQPFATLCDFIQYFLAFPGWRVDPTGLVLDTVYMVYRDTEVLAQLPRQSGFSTATISYNCNAINHVLQTPV
jgi:hypothetical protein